MRITRSKQYGARTHRRESATSPTAEPLEVICIKKKLSFNSEI